MNPTLLVSISIFLDLTQPQSYSFSMKGVSSLCLSDFVERLFCQKGSLQNGWGVLVDGFQLVGRARILLGWFCFPFQPKTNSKISLKVFISRSVSKIFLGR